MKNKNIPVQRLGIRNHAFRSCRRRCQPRHNTSVGKHLDKSHRVVFMCRNRSVAYESSSHVTTRPHQNYFGTCKRRKAGRKGPFRRGRAFRRHSCLTCLCDSLTGKHAGIHCHPFTMHYIQKFSRVLLLLHVRQIKQRFLYPMRSLMRWDGLVLQPAIGRDWPNTDGFKNDNSTLRP